MLFTASGRRPANGSLRPRPLLRATIAVIGGFVVIRLKADVTWIFIAVALGMVAFGLFALPPLISRSGYE